METNNKKYGVYDGGLFSDSIDPSNCTEKQLYITIRILENSITGMRIFRNEKDNLLDTVKYALEYCMMQTRRYGVKIEDPKEAEHVIASASYREWVEFWDWRFERQRAFDESNNKQYGVYDGGVFDDFLDPTSCSEENLFLSIKILGDSMIGMQRKGTYEDNMMYALLYAVQYCMMQTRRFGVEIQEPKEGEYVDATNSYSSWFMWWRSYFEAVRNSDEWDKLRTAQKAGKDESSFRPKGDWRKNISL